MSGHMLAAEMRLTLSAFSALSVENDRLCGVAQSGMVHEVMFVMTTQSWKAFKNRLLETEKYLGVLRNKP